MFLLVPISDTYNIVRYINNNKNIDLLYGDTNGNYY